MVAEPKSIIVVAPVFNEQANIREFISKIALIREPAVVRGLLIVDDGSTDQSVTLIEELAGSVKFQIKIVRLSRNFGHQNAVLAGIEKAYDWACVENVEWIGLIDADMQDRPEHFMELMKETKGYDVVYAIRKTRKDGFFMRLMAPLFYKLLSRGASFSIPENAGTFCLMRSPVVNLIVKNSDSEPYFPGLRAWIGFRQKGVEIDREQRFAGKSQVGKRGLFSLALRAMLLYSNLLQNAIIFCGAVILAGCILISTILIFMRILGYITIPGATTIVVLQLITLGIQLLFLGITAHMINRIKLNTSKQKSWVIMEEKIF